MKIAKNPFLTQTTDNNSFATRPGGIILSERRLRRFHPELYNAPPWFFWKHKRRKANHWHRLNLAERLYHGDSQPAIVAQTKPFLIVAAYTCELDCVALLGFENEHPEQGLLGPYPPGLSDELICCNQLKPGSHLLTVNCYTEIHYGVAPDLILGPRSRRVYGNVLPLIADFLTDDKNLLEQSKARIREDEWQHALELAKEALSRPIGYVRDGRPLYMGESAEPEA